jgi:hypothetical protein
MDEMMKRTNKRSLLLMGALIIGTGAVWLLYKMHVLDMPYWLFSWKTVVVLIGLLVGIQSSFKGFSWMILIIVGGVFMLGDLPGVGTEMRQYRWPLLLILLGMVLVLRALLKKTDESFWSNQGIKTVSGDDNIDIVSIFGGSKRKIFSKNFTGGEVVGIFGGAELDLTQADIKDRATLDVTNIFGGLKIIVPANWSIKSDVTTIMGGMDDKRPTTNSMENVKTLVLTGFCMFGGIDIRSYQ